MNETTSLVLRSILVGATAVAACLFVVFAVFVNQPFFLIFAVIDAIICYTQMKTIDRLAKKINSRL